MHSNPSLRASVCARVGSSRLWAVRPIPIGSLNSTLQNSQRTEMGPPPTSSPTTSPAACLPHVSSTDLSSSPIGQASTVHVRSRRMTKHAGKPLGQHRTAHTQEKSKQTREMGGSTRLADVAKKIRITAFCPI